jgi:hypothetical protein
MRVVADEDEDETDAAAAADAAEEADGDAENLNLDQRIVAENLDLARFSTASDAFVAEVRAWQALAAATAGVAHLGLTIVRRRGNRLLKP